MILFMKTVTFLVEIIVISHEDTAGYLYREQRPNKKYVGLEYGKVKSQQCKL